jgi:nucleotide-binding universal stress UspA family protein
MSISGAFAGRRISGHSREILRRDQGSASTNTVMRDRWIVVGTDFSEGAREALERALRVAEGLSASVALVHAYEDEPGGRVAADYTSSLMGRLAEEIAASAATRLGIGVVPLLRRGPPWDKILNVATDYGAEMIVVGGSGERGPMCGIPLGSVANRVLSLSKRCVLVTRSGVGHEDEGMR